MDNYSSPIIEKVLRFFWGFFKRIFSPGSSGRSYLYRLRKKYERPLRIGDTRPPLPIDEALSQFISSIQQTQPEQIVIILASTELNVDEGQRSTNLALEFSERGIPCVFAYWRWEHDLWLPQDRLDQGILQIPVDVIATWPETVLRNFDCEEKILLFEFPHPSTFKLLSEANAAGWFTIYDVVDDWGEFLKVDQAIWYDEDFENHLLNAVDAVTVVNQTLDQMVRIRSPRSPILVHNGLSEGIEVVDETRSLERGRVTVGYFGYLAGAWFDWELIVQTAYRNPDWCFYLIGYGGSSQELELPGNVHLLGKKPRHELASYAANWDVAIVPFKPEKLAAGADPIKSYEYLAMGLPVVLTGVYPPQGAEKYLKRAVGVHEFEEVIRSGASQRDHFVQERKDFANRNTWDVRVEQLLKIIESGKQRVAEKRSLFRVE